MSNTVVSFPALNYGCDLRAMGYRKLLKGYMHHVNAVLGSDLVELAAMTNALNKRDIGELRAIAAELRRDSFSDQQENNYDHVVHEMLQDGQIKVDQLAGIDGLEVGDDNEMLSPEAFRRILLTLLELASSDNDAAENDTEEDEAAPTAS